MCSSCNNKMEELETSLKWGYIDKGDVSIIISLPAQV